MPTIRGQRLLRSCAANPAAGLLLLLAGLAGGCHQVQDNVPGGNTQAAPERVTQAGIDPESRRVRQAPAPGGVPVPDTRVVVPQDAKAGSAIRIVAPAGSVVTFGGVDTRVPADGVLLLDAPATGGKARLAVVRPDGRRLVFRIRIE